MSDTKPILIEVSRLIFRLLKGCTVTGIDRVTLAYIDHYLDRAQAVISYKGAVNILNREDSAVIFHSLLKNKIKISSRLFFKLLSKKLLNLDANLHQYAGCYYFNLNHKGIESTPYIEKLKMLQLKPIFFIHDLIPIYYPEYCREEEKNKHHERVLHMLRAGAGLIVNSNYTKQEVLRFAEEHHVPAPEIMVSWLSSYVHEKPSNTVKIHQQIQKKYFVFVATIEARKNHLMLLQVWKRLVDTLGHEAPYLILVGQRGWESEQVFDLLDRCESLQQHVLEMSSQGDADLIGLVKHAQALLFPSFVEGYGLPLVEALSLNVPVIASNIEVFQEIGQGIPEFLDPIDSLAWYNMIMEYYAPDSSSRAAQMQRLKHYQHWTWAKHFQQVDELLKLGCHQAA